MNRRNVFGLSAVAALMAGMGIHVGPIANPAPAPIVRKGASHRRGSIGKFGNKWAKRIRAKEIARASRRANLKRANRRR